MHGTSDSDLATVFGRRVRSIREERGLTLEQAAEAAGLGTGALSEIENAKRWRTRFEQLTRLAEALGVTVSELMSEPTHPRKIKRPAA